MVLRVLDLSFELIDIIDVYESLIWTDRYNRYGDFELTVIPNSYLLDLLQMDRIIEQVDTYRAMFIEQRELKTDPQEGNRLIVSGRSLDVLLTRRIIWPVFNKELILERYLIELINWCFPTSDKNRGILNFRVDVKSSDAMDAIKNIKITSQHTGDRLYDVICEICNIYSIGFDFTISENISYRMDLTTGEETVHFWYSPYLYFYAGTDRSYAQNKNPWIVFSDNFNNLGATDDLESLKELGTIAYIAGEEEQPSREWTTLVTQEVSNPMLRREIFVDARDIQSTYHDENGDEQTISKADYIQLLKSRGEEKMQEYVRIHDYSSNVDSNIEHVYGVDYHLGDIVEIVNSYGHEVRARVMELVLSDDPEGLKVYPTFEIIE